MLLSLLRHPTLSIYWLLVLAVNCCQVHPDRRPDPHPLPPPVCVPEARCGTDVPFFGGDSSLEPKELIFDENPSATLWPKIPWPTCRCIQTLLYISCFKIDNNEIRTISGSFASPIMQIILCLPKSAAPAVWFAEMWCPYCVFLPKNGIPIVTRVLYACVCGSHVLFRGRLNKPGMFIVIITRPRPDRVRGFSNSRG